MAEIDNPYPEINWAEEPIINVINGAEEGIELARQELIKRQEQMNREIAILSNTNDKGK